MFNSCLPKRKANGKICISSVDAPLKFKFQATATCQNYPIADSAWPP